MTEPKKKQTGKVRVTGLPRCKCWPACNAEKKFGVTVPEFRALKLGETVELIGDSARSVADKLVAANLVKLEGGK